MTGGIDVAAVRADTPGCTQVVHLNNAGAALPPRVVTETMLAHLRREAEIGGYEAADEAADRLQAVYASLAALLGCSPEEVALLQSSTLAWDSACFALPLRAGDRVLVSRAEYTSNALALLQLTERAAVRIELIRDDDSGQLDVGDLERRLGPDVGLVAVTHVPTYNGLVNPAARIGAVTRAAGVPFLLDACQSVGQLPTLVDELGVDLLAGTGRKFLRGPRGVGFLYVRAGLTERLRPPFVDLRSGTWTGRDTFELAPGARRFESWESDVAARLGLGAAVDYALALGLAPIADRVRHLAARLRTQLAELPGVAVHDRGAQRSGIVTFSATHLPAARLTGALRAQRINTSVSERATTHYDERRRDLPDLVRASVHYYNTTEELDRAVAAVAALSAG